MNKKPPILTKETLQRELDAGKSPEMIAAENHTYCRKISRLMKTYGISSRSRSDALKLAMEHGRATIPTAGKQRTEEEKLKISKGISNAWKELPPEEYERRVERARLQWENMSEEDKQSLSKAAHVAIRAASTYGSKLENYLVDRLRETHVVLHHTTGLFGGEKLEVDLLLEHDRVVIEIDGISHRDGSVWGEDKLERVRLADSRKNGIILSSGFVMIRVKCVSKPSLARQEKLLEEIKIVLEKIKTEFPPIGERLIHLEF